jgi:hypothetical protein
MNKTLKAAIAAKKDGYKYMTSLVKSKFNTRYHHIVRIDDVIESEKWIPAPHVQFSSGAHGPAGSSTVPPKSINKGEAIIKYCK